MPRSNKDWMKLIRGIIEGVLLLLLAIVIIKAFYAPQKYVPFKDRVSESAYQTEKGFIALSYFGVSFSDKSAASLISKNRLKEHLSALRNSGYVTITQQDIINYYKLGSPLPEKSLFLMFEDGRNDTVIFAGKIMKELNLVGTILTYAQNIIGKDNKFLHEKDLDTLQDNTFWEIGAGGYRLTYINVFDRYGSFLNILTPTEFIENTEVIDNDYNHYLMDYIRDENRIPTENLNQLTSRINYDYNEMVNIYQYTLKQIPLLHTLMHSNTGQFGTNDKASKINEENIKSNYQINFNREGEALNQKETDLYDLTRLSPEPDWYTNHLLMRIWEDTNEKLAFSYGDLTALKNWKVISGQPQFTIDSIILTTPPEKDGLLLLKEFRVKDLDLTVELRGREKGEQAIYLRADKELKQYISVSVIDNKVVIKEHGISTEDTILFSKNLIEPEENISEVNTGENINGAITQNNPEENETKHRLLKITTRNNKITLEINNQLIINNLEVNILEKGYVILKCKYSKEAFEEGILWDSIYDGVYQNLHIVSLDKKDKTTIINMNLQGMDKIRNKLKNMGAEILRWFIETL